MDSLLEECLQSHCKSDMVLREEAGASCSGACERWQAGYVKTKATVGNGGESLKSNCFYFLGEVKSSH